MKLSLRRTANGTVILRVSGTDNGRRYTQEFTAPMPKDGGFSSDDFDVQAGSMLVDYDSDVDEDLGDTFLDGEETFSLMDDGVGESNLKQYFPPAASQPKSRPKVIKVPGGGQ